MAHGSSQCAEEALALGGSQAADECFNAGMRLHQVTLHVPQDCLRMFWHVRPGDRNALIVFALIVAHAMVTASGFAEFLCDSLCVGSVILATATYQVLGACINAALPAQVQKPTRSGRQVSLRSTDPSAFEVRRRALAACILAEYLCWAVAVGKSHQNVEAQHKEKSPDMPQSHKNPRGPFSGQATKITEMTF